MQEDEVKIINETDLSSDIFGRAVKGGAWLFALRILSHILSMTKLIILCRLLDPDDFGLLGVATLSIGVLLSFSEIGLRQALIQKKDNIESYLDLAWTINIIRGLVLFLVMFIVSPFIADFFNRLDAVVIIRVIAVSLIFNGFANIGVVYFAKELEFHKKFILEIAGTIVGVVVVIVLAFIYRNVWALVFGMLFSSFTRCVMSYILHSYRPKLSFDFVKFRELWRFGKHFFWIKIFKYICLHGDDIFLGKFLGTTFLGYYQQAYRVGTLVAIEIGDKIAEISFPVFSKLQNNIEKIRGGFLKSIQVSSLVVYPVSGGLIVLAYEFTGLVLGEKWLPMVPAMQLLCILGTIKCMQWASVFMALGRPDIMTKLTFLRLMIIATTIYPLAVKFGMTGVAFCVLLPSLATHPIAFYMLEKLAGIKIKDIVGLLCYPIFAMLVAMLTVFLAKKIILDIGLIELGLLICLGAVTYCVIIFLISRFSKRYDAISLVRDIVKGMK